MRHMKRSFVVLSAIIITTTSSAFAQSGQRKAGASSCVTREFCVQRGVGHGWSAIQAGRWCDRNRASETCYK